MTWDCPPIRPSSNGSTSAAPGSAPRATRSARRWLSRAATFRKPRSCSVSRDPRSTICWTRTESTSRIARRKAEHEERPIRGNFRMTCQTRARSAARACALLACLLVPLAACSPSGEKLLARAEEQLAVGEYRGAMIDLRNYLARNPDDARARVDLGLAMLELGEVTAAEEEIAKATGLGAGRDQTLLVECRLMVARASYQKALDECTSSGADASRAVELAVVRGEALLGLRRYDEARASFESVLKAQPQNLNALQGLAIAAFGAGGIEAARTVFAGAPEQVRSRPRYWLALGSLELRASALEEAEKAFEAALARSSDDDKEGPDALGALAGLTETQLRLNKLDAARASSERLLTAAPNSRIAKLLSAQVAASGGDDERAREQLEELVSANPDDLQADR